MTDYENLAGPGFSRPDAKNSEADSLSQQARPDAASSALESAEFPSRRSLRAASPAVESDVVRAAVAPAHPGSRRAAREAREVVSAPVVPAVPVAPQVAAPFGMFEAPASADAAPRTQARGRGVAGRSTRKSQAGPSPRRRLSTVGVMLLVPGLFATFTLPAYAAVNYTGDAPEAAAAVDGQALALDASAVDKVAAVADTRDGYDATSAADLKRLYRDALRQQRIASYLASGALALGDDYPWATELGMDEGGGLSPLRYFVRQCTDFVAWRLNRDAGSTSAPFKYDWSTLTPGGGSARSWKSQWEKHGWAVSTTPAPGWVAWFPNANHVAYVNSVLADGSVLIEEYNWGDDVYNQRIIPASSVLYLAPPSS
ncbi:MAG: CHAP domain-containing protein [Leifsonia xyli]|nr:MAG: CHAP domain-containing protein [Leifsonia xyli]